MTALEDRLICFNCETIGGEKTVSLKVRYRLLQRVENTDIFSIEIVTDMCGEKDVAFADSITADVYEARSIFQALYQGRVTSCTLFDILEDSIGVQ